MLYNIPGAGAKHHFGSSAFPLTKFGLDSKMTVYAGLLAVAANLFIAALATWGLRASGIADGVDSTRATDYTADEIDARPSDTKKLEPGLISG
jgi:SSS family solute:Na+ symporter